MTYKNQKVRMSMGLIDDYIHEMGWNIVGCDVYRFWRQRQWTENNGRKIESVEEAANLYYGIIQRKAENKALRKAQKEADREVKAEERRRRWQRFLDSAYRIYTDGACDNNHSRIGGAGYIILKDGEVVKMKSKGFTSTTNNRMELLAIISALNSLSEGSNAVVYTDSQYCIRVLDGNMHEKNQDLLLLFQNIRRRLGKVVFKWVKGHNGDEYNEMADRLAFSAYAEMCEKTNAP